MAVVVYMLTHLAEGQPFHYLTATSCQWPQVTRRFKDAMLVITH